MPPAPRKATSDTGSTGACWRPPCFVSPQIGTLGDAEEPDGWGAETLASEIAADCGLAPPRVNIDKIFAAKAIVKTDRFHNELKPFVDLCNVLGGSPYNPTVFDPADALECAWGLAEAMVLSPLEDNEKYSPEIVGYIEQALKTEGISKPPGLFRDLGLKDDDSVADEWRNDPETYTAIWAAQRKKSSDIEHAVGVRLALMRDQFRFITFHHGSSERFVEVLSKFLAHYGL